MTQANKTSRGVKKRSAPNLSGHLETVTVKDFKSLKDVTVALGQVSVFVGANGAGKSCLLEAIGILGACAAGAVDDQALLRRGVRPGVPELYKSSFGTEKVAPKISLRAVSRDGADYHAYITNPTKNPGPYWVFGNETLKEGRKSVASRGPSGRARALEQSVALENNRSVTTLVRASQKTPLATRAMLAGLDGFAIFAPVTPVLRGIAPDTAPRSPVGLYGGQLAEAVALLATQERGARAIREALSMIDWAKSVTAGEPKRSFLSPSVPTSRIVVEFKDRFMGGGRNTLSGYDASEGALYVLFMLVLAAHSQSPRIFAVDNFDQALNPRTARELTRVFVSHALDEDRQVLLTTHNPLVLDGLDLGGERVRLFTVGRDRAGHTKVKRVPVKNFAALKEKHGEHAVSRLWVEGRLGGMPDV
ncbi:MAG: AAA family ATPase [Polyangiaceae bacterium]|nr:AAA family ATPase [Polyangiaceae bacterium]